MATGGKLRAGVLTLPASVVIGVASAGPAYSITATLGLVVAAVGLQAPIIVLLAFVPMLLVAIGYRELNRADPDAGTTFVWATRAFGPFWGWMSGWAIVVADLLVMASLAQVSAQYSFLLFDAEGIGTDSSSPWVLLVGIAFIAAMTWVAVRGIDISARVQKVLLAVEVVMLAVFAVVALVRVAIGNAGAQAITPSWSWFDPFAIDSFSTFVNATLLMVFIYWGWDSVVSVNEETADPRRTPGRSAVLATVALVSLYIVVTIAAQAFAGVGTEGIGLSNPEHVDDVLGGLGEAVFGASPVGNVLVHLLVLMVLTSAAASTQTTILPTSRTTFSMAVHGALPALFGRVHPRWRTPTVSTIAFGVASVALFVLLDATSGGMLVIDAVSAIGISVGFYYGITGFACMWLYRSTFRTGTTELLARGVLPGVGGALLVFATVWTAVSSWQSDYGETALRLPFPPHWEIGAVFVLGVGSMALGVPLYLLTRARMPAFFRGQVLDRELPSVPSR
ncbi:MAG: APC family permease [Aldersonia sp.]|nr:APC family permease [Aldersonia sp.]